MKNIFLKTVITVCLFAVLACNASGKKGYVSGVEVNFHKDASYALGVDLGSSFKAVGITPDINELLAGILDVLNGKETRIAPEEAGMIINEAVNNVREEREAVNMLAEIEFLSENGQNPGIITTESGLQYEILAEGDGESPHIADTVKVHYQGSLINGEIFDSSYTRDEPTEFPVGGVIPGWAEGLQLMNIGSKYRFFIPSELGYGQYGAGPKIPPYSTLIFEVELLEVLHNH